MNSSLQLSDYASFIDLDVPFDRSVRSKGDCSMLLAGWLHDDAGLAPKWLPDGHDAHRALITRLLTVRPPRPIPSHVLEMIDALFAAEAADRNPVRIEEVLMGPPVPISVGSTTLQLWRGDITTLEVDAIVNAANADMLGCFRPAHRCIDNAIHTIAGPRLRDDCHRIMERQGHKEPTGTAKATRAYYLPSRFVLHTVGPIITGGAVTADDSQLLASCYESCLNLAVELGARTVAFCAVSTGVFGYPKEEAATRATETVMTWLDRHPGAMDVVIFNVFSEQDEAVYRGVGPWA